MSHRPFRFLHASDLHLDAVPSGLAYIPPHLKDAMVGASLEAFARLVDAAIAESVDFVVLAGDAVDVSQIAPSTLSRFAASLEPLTEAEVPVYWAAGDVDAQTDWPPAIELPEVIHRFLGHAVTRVKHTRDNRPLVELVGSGKKRKKKFEPNDYLNPQAPLPTIVVAHGTIDARKAEKALTKQPASTYFALGGEHQRDTLLSGAHTIHYSGTPQGLHPTEGGPHGVTLVEFDQDGVFHTSLIETDVLRWCDETLEISRSTTSEELESMLRGRLDALAEANLNRTLIVDCSVTGDGQLLSELRVAGLADTLAEMLQSDYGQRETPIWVRRIAIQPATKVPAPATQDTILGDFLHTIAAFESGDQSLDLSSLLASTESIETNALSMTNGMEEVLDAARSRGIELLGGDAQDDTSAIAEGTLT